MPGGAPTSEQLHIVVGLSAGMGDNPGSPDCPSPTDKLKEALCSQEAFNKTYLVRIFGHNTGGLLIIEIIFVRLATHLRFYVGTFAVKFNYDSSKVKINQMVFITIY
jgi:hypothetical protein